ncbi:hypothetical protein FBQ97_00165 [Acidobacteria bacterium ACD]|nr:MAG: hypothetical protein EDX89_05615 [Acidobacteriota bacterium]MCE7956352.1 hypothetical protein [Acidobacteria bacterium ACB2]MDL1948219.1 hypothetical protein [Acidobacteria bacterium ACD]
MSVQTRAAVIAILLAGNPALLALDALTTAYSTTVKEKATLKVMRDGAEKDLPIEPKPLQFGSSLQLNSGSGSSTLQPVIEAHGTIGGMKPKRKSNLYGDFKLSLKSEPVSGDAEEIADAIRIDTGTLAVNAGAIWTYFFYPPEHDDGPLGFEARGAAQFSYQRVPELSISSGVSDPGTSPDFGILAPEVRVGVWLKYAFLGYKYSYAVTFGQASPVSTELDRTSTHKAILIAKVEPLSGQDGKSPFFIECQYTGGRNSFDGGSFSFAITKAFSAGW